MKTNHVATIMLVAFVVAGYFLFRNPLIERIDDPNNTAVWTCPGCPKGSSVSYTDRRWPERTVHYYDSSQNGLIDTIQFGEFHRTGVDELGLATGYYEKRVQIMDGRNLVTDWNNKASEWKDGRSAVMRDSEEGRRYQQQYEEVRAAYLKLNPDVDLKENRPLTPAPPEPISTEKVRLFFDLLTEYNTEEAKCQRQQRSQRASEMAQYRAFLTFLELRSAYRALNKAEKESVFNRDSDLPTGIKLDGGTPVTQIAGLKFTSEDPRDDFESFLQLSYMETDYMSAWSLTDAQTEKIREQYQQELRAKGLKTSG